MIMVVIIAATEALARLLSLVDTSAGIVTKETVLHVRVEVC